MLRALLPLVLLAFASLSASAQYMMEAKQPDFYNLADKQEQRLTQDALERIPLAYRNHPEYAKNPYNSPCTNCTELIDRRKADERFFIENGTKGQTVYVQKSMGPMHVKDASGNWISLDPRISLTAPGVYAAENQHYPVKIDLNQHFISIKTPGHEFRFNTKLELVHKDVSGTITSLGEANWTNYSAGIDGVKVFDAWPGIDMEMQAMQGRVKTNFVVKERLPLSEGWLIVKDKLEYPDDIKPDYLLATQTGDNQYEGTISFNDAGGQEYYTIDRAFVRDAAEQGEPFYLSYELSAEKDLSVIVPVEWLNDESRIYPVKIDPLFSSSNNLPLGSIPGSQYGPQVPCGGGACWTNGCPYMLSVPVPANCTVTDILFSFNYNAISGCLMNEGAMDFSLGACRSPSVPQAFWFCNPSPPQGGACNGNNLSIFSHIASCIPNPQCPSYNLTFGMKFYRSNPFGGNACSNLCIAANSPWIMTVQGKSVEIPTITGAQIMCIGNSVNITASGNFGVPPYSYLWSPGGMTGTTVSVSPATTTTYTATITDACGQVATANSTVNVTQNTNPGFTITPNPVCAGQPVALAGLGVGPSSSYDWLLPNSTTPTVNNNKTPSVTYNNAGTYNITLNYQQGACTFPNVQQITVTPSSGSPSVTVAASPSGPICAGTSVTFTPTPTNGGGSPTYQWQVNGSNAGTGATFTSSSLNNNDDVTVIMTSSSACVSPTTATSAAIIMVVNPTLTPSVTIAANPSGAICAGASVTFTATPTNGGTPTYQWQVNGSNAGTGATFTSSSLNNGDVVQVIMTSNALCASPLTATSNTINITVNPPVTPSLTIAASPSGAICPGTNVTFTPTPTNGGGLPTYQWQVNGANAGTGSTFSTVSLNNGDVVHAIMTSDANCVVPLTAASNDIAITVTPAPVPSVSISANPAGPICAGTSITFTATPTNGGTTPTYQWQVNGSNAGTGVTFASAALNNNDVVEVIMTSNAVCASPLTATSNALTITVNSTLVPAVSISANPSGPVCFGTSILFTPSPVSGGNNPIYQWMVNGTNAGNGATFTSTTLNNGDVVSVVMTSSAGCASPTTASSNNLTMTIFPVVVPSVTIAASPSGAICSGASVTFTATPTNGGVGPVYQWQVNGTNAGSGGATFTSATLNNGDNVTVILTSNAPCVSPVAATSNAIAMAVTATVVPSVTVAAVPAGQICTGTAVTFTATPTDGGTSPTYQWQVNGTNSGTGATFTSSSLNDNDVVTVVMTSNATCASPATASSSAITMSVSSVVVPAVTIAAAPSNTICAGTNVTVTATPNGGGNTPTYQWTLNGTNAGTGSTFSSSAFNDNDVIEVVMTSSSTCANPQTATSNQVVMTVDVPVVPAVSIADAPGGTQCTGTNITFTPTPVNGGSNPAYQWQVNGVNAGTGATYASSSLNDGDVISVVLTSDAVCANPTTAASNSITVAIDQVLVPSVSVSAVPAGTICAGVQVDFTATPTDAGANPTYQWTVNGTNAGTGDTFSSTLADGDVVAVTLTSTSACANPNTATSAPVTMDVGTFVTPSVTISASPAGPICNGASVTYTAVATDGGSSPVYEWQVNGTNVGSGATFTSATLNEGDIVTALLTSSEPCVNNNPATSNQIVVALVSPLAVVASDDILVCSNATSTLDAVATGGDGIYTYTWDNNAGNGASVNVNPAQTTTYTVTVNDQCGSTPATDDVTVTVNNVMAYFTFTPEEANMFDAEIRFENGSQGGSTYLWDFGDGSTSTDEDPIHPYTAPGVYEVTLIVTSPEGCEATTHYSVTITDVIAFWVPSSFTPNGDGLNDSFGMQGTFDMPYTMRIFNRLGSEIYFTSTSEPWNGGIFNEGEVVQNGVYIYEIDLDDSDYKGKPISGRVTVLRDGR